MRNYVPIYDKLGICKDRYNEMVHFCRQYREWDTAAQMQIRTQANREQLSALARKMKLVLSCAAAVADGQWADALMIHICENVPYRQLDAALLPTAHREAFFAAVRDFFALLNERLP